jgi:hypothetical protein
VRAREVAIYESFREFYPYYLSEHANRICRRLHFVGTSLALALLLVAMITRSPWWLGGAVVAGYGFAWVGHAFFERNRPATFQYPLYSLRGDALMWLDILRGKMRF